MKKRKLFISLFIAAFFLSACAGNPDSKGSIPDKQLPVPETGFYITDGRLYDGFGNQLIMRGVNHAHTWYTSITSRALPCIQTAGSNTVRLVLSNGKRWTRTSTSNIRSLISDCKKNKLIAVLEVHDTTGFGQEADACSIAEAADYWLSVREALEGQEAYAIINIGNEPYGNNIKPGTWLNDHIAAVKKLREAGLKHTIMVDAPDWGQDSRRIMLNSADEIFNADPLKNTMFSVHMYQVYGQESLIKSYLSAALESGMCFIVGEFGDAHFGQQVDEKSIMKICHEYGLGYLGWSWSGNSGGTENLDIARHWNPSKLSPWGETLINGEFGIRNTSKICSVFTIQ